MFFGEGKIHKEIMILLCKGVKTWRYYKNVIPVYNMYNRILIPFWFCSWKKEMYNGITIPFRIFSRILKSLRKWHVLHTIHRKCQLHIEVLIHKNNGIYVQCLSWTKCLLHISRKVYYMLILHISILRKVYYILRPFAMCRFLV